MHNLSATCADIYVREGRDLDEVPPSWVAEYSLHRTNVQATPRMPSCPGKDDEAAITNLVLPEFRKDVQGDTGLTVVVRETDSSHFAQEFDLRQLLINDQAAGLRPRLSASPPGSTTIFASPASGYFPIPAQARADLEQAYRDGLKHPCRVQFPNSKESQILYVRGSELSGRSWRRIEAAFGSDVVLVNLSRAAVDETHHYAMIHAGANWKRGGCGQLFLLHRENDRWVIKRVFPTWTT
jgi:hypothetical protein